MTPAQQTLQKIASLVFLTLATVCITAPAYCEPLDTTKLPRVPGAKEDYATPDTTIYTSPDLVDVTAKAVRAILTADGWQLYGSPPYEAQTESHFQSQSFKKGPHAVSAYTVIAPAKNNTTSVQYAAIEIKYDLPVPKDATEIGFDYNGAHLECVTAETVDAMLEFYRTELTAQGWSRWSPPGTAKLVAAPEASDTSGKSLRTHFVKDQENPLLLVLHTEKPRRTIVYLKAVPSEDMIAEYAPKKAPEPAPVVAPPAAEKSAADGDDEEDINAKFEDLVKGLIKEAIKPVDKSAKKAKEKAEAEAAAAAETGEPLRALAGNTVPIPLPETAEEIEHKGDKGSLEFTSSSSVKAVAAFYREQMKALGWKAQKSVINSEKMVALNFSKDRKDLSFTIMQMGKKVDVDADGDVLKTEAEVSESPAATPSAATLPFPDEPLAMELPGEAPKEVAEKDLEAEIMKTGGLLVPKPHSYSGGTKSKFRVEANASVPATVASVTGFYRTELGKLGWKEEAGATVEAEKADLKFNAPQGPASLKLARKGGETTVALVLRDLDGAKKSGLMPKAGQSKVMFGNIFDDAAVASIDKKQFKVKPGAGAERPDGPSIELAPGTHKLTIKSGGKEKTEEIVVGADEIWGVLVGPNGALQLQMY